MRTDNASCLVLRMADLPGLVFKPVRTAHPGAGKIG